MNLYDNFTKSNITKSDGINRLSTHAMMVLLLNQFTSSNKRMNH